VLISVQRRSKAICGSECGFHNVVMQTGDVLDDSIYFEQCNTLWNTPWQCLSFWLCAMCDCVSAVDLFILNEEKSESNPLNVSE